MQSHSLHGIQPKVGKCQGCLKAILSLDDSLLFFKDCNHSYHAACLWKILVKINRVVEYPIYKKESVSVSFSSSTGTTETEETVNWICMTCELSKRKVITDLSLINTIQTSTPLTSVADLKGKRPEDREELDDLALSRFISTEKTLRLNMLHSFNQLLK
jgi:hypothetical protein